ncbi:MULTISPECIES: 3-oxoacyl-[acyl-carrier-protein] synthase III C-terminal domain-containing protein [unclassified Streptomyces]|uniref:3-oxoacyl-[acyl-carrier-protein] synthase III C-terminal domain-containing protein n=1 Tax=unclassified Streptomyces TaxID=2593676 RepID=UPI002DD9D695|nr:MULTISPECIES: 3-oxoacyl-[acyl-carrier-protein] synthase III C-terminal domain-containing protein [unclassified Streptomyces]WSA95439.1 3-oxoacyl-ACP synthase [Streptomyces sp. NBC_01795]WSB79855.1 3-oxoacyl-ACP synthase [Streptomyces sp. NBC_01775]WSS40652.1 3-oxoacyl-ACP synthase [Streptomyces sp. NBC_01187]
MSPLGTARRGIPLYLLGVGTALPGEPVDNEALSSRLGIASEWVETFIGTRTRHFAVDLEGGHVRWTLEDLCTDAADRALADAGVEPDDIGFLVLATATPDALMPTTAALLADRLGIGGTPAYQLQSGCSGAVQALALARALLAEGTGGGGPGLVVGGDVCTKHLDLRQDFRRLPPGALVNYVLFGDGAGAALVGAAPGPRTRATLTHVTHRLDGLGLPPGQRVEWFGAADLEPYRPAATEDYKAVEDRVPVMALEVRDELLDACGWPPDSVDHLLPPQLNGRMTQRITRELSHGLEWQDVSCVAETGNNGNALVFLQLERLLARIHPGQRALGIAIESSKWIKAGFTVEAPHA